MALPEYFENELLPGKPMFRCERLSASLRVSSCAEMWVEANRLGAGDRNYRCRSCPIGAVHAGAKDPAVNPLRGSTLCVRCARTDMRLIHGLVCVSCANRAYEWRKGKNAKGAFPKQHPGLVKVRVRFCVEGKAKHLEREVADAAELVVELLRDQESRIVFGMGRGRGAT